jgi:hypothetical protein
MGESMLKLKVKAIVLVAIAVLFSAIQAKADQFDLVASGPGTNINLILNGTLSSTPGVFDITGLSGTVDGLGATLLATSAPGVVTDSTTINSYYIEYDNLLFLNGGAYLDLYGLGFTLSDGTIGNLFYSGGYLYSQLGNNPPDTEQVSVSLVAPEPGSLALIASGLLAICLLAMRKQLA